MAGHKRAAYPGELVSVRGAAVRHHVSPALVRRMIYVEHVFPHPWRIGGAGEPHLYLVEEVDAAFAKRSQIAVKVSGAGSPAEATHAS